MKLSYSLNNYNIIIYNNFWKNMFFSSIGLNKLFLNTLYMRYYMIKYLFLPKSFNKVITDILYFNIFFFYSLIYIPSILSYKLFLLNQLLTIDFCAMYKTYRHIFGLPVNGQRTWSNANTSYYNNLLLRQYKLKKFSTFLRNSKPLSFKKIFLCEYVNLFWQKQFFLEWVSVRRKKYLFQRRNLYIHYKVDFNFLVNANIEHFYKRTLELKKKKITAVNASLQKIRLMLVDNLVFPESILFI